MSQGDISKSPKRTESSQLVACEEIVSTPQHRILVTKPSSSPPRSRSQSAGSAHKEALLFFERNKLFQERGEASVEIDVAKIGTNGEEEKLIRNRSIRGRSHSQPSQVLLSTGGRGEFSSSRTYNSSTNGGGGSGDIVEILKGKCSSWLEEIQFTAQYQHYRSNDYCSVVNSASSLDKAGKEQEKVEDGSKLQQGTSSGLSLQQPSAVKGRREFLSSPPPKGPPLCFHFPRVKLPRIFNAKSLDDILGSKLNRSKTHALSSTTASSTTSPHPRNLEIGSFDAESYSSIGITTPGITNTTAGLTATSGYFSDFDRRESCDLLVVDPNNDEVGRKRHSSFAGYSEVNKAVSGSEIVEGFEPAVRRTTLPPIHVHAGAPSLIEGSLKETTESSNTSSGRKASNTASSSSRQKLETLLRIPNFSSKDKKSPKISSKGIKKSPHKAKTPSKSLSSGSLNKISCANGERDLIPISSSSGGSKGASSSANEGETSSGAKNKSDNYLNRFVSSTTARFLVGGNTNSNNKADQKSSTTTKKKGRSSIGGTSVSSEAPSEPQQRKWTAVKQKWDLKLQLQEDSQDAASSLKSQVGLGHFLLENQPQGHRHSADYCQAGSGRGKRAGALLDPNSSRPRRSLDELESFSREEIQPHEPGRVSFRLEPEEIPDSVFKNFSSTSETTSSPLQSVECKEVCSKEELLSDLGEGEEEEDEMTKTMKQQHFHYITKDGVTVKSSSKSKSNINQKEGASKEKEKAQLVVANVSFLQRPTSPCVLSPTPTSMTPTASSPIVSGLVGMGLPMTQQDDKAPKRNINEARLKGDNVNVHVCGGLSCLRYNRDDVLSPTGTGFEREGAKNAVFGVGECKKSDSGTSSKSSQFQIGKGDKDYTDSRQRLDPRSKAFDEEHLLDEEEEMGDLQSPTYVKRTAHMFNNIYSTQNGSSSASEHNPSYLNVSKTMSGYSRLSYNNNSSLSNGSGGLKSGGLRTTTVSVTSNGTNGTSSTSPYSPRFVNGGQPSSGTSPGKVRSEIAVRVNPEETSCRERTLSPTRVSAREDEVIKEIEETSYVPSHGKSFIMQKIERLYGPDAHTVSSSGIISKKSGGSSTTIRFESVHHHQHVSSSRKERIIPIQVEKENAVPKSFPTVSKDKEVVRKQEFLSEKSGRGQGVGVGEIVLSKGDQTDLSTMASSSATSVSTSVPFSRNESEMLTQNRSYIQLEPCLGQHKLNTINLDEEEGKRLLISRSNSHSVVLDPSADTNANTKVVDEKLSETDVVVSSPPNQKEEEEEEEDKPKGPNKKEDLKDGNYFLEEMKSTSSELQKLCEKARPELEELDEESERAGSILAAIGKSNLLIKKKFKQFEELCNANLQGAKSDEPATTNADLEGFWDMVMIQVEQVYGLFKEIDGTLSSVEMPQPRVSTTAVSPRKTASTKAAIPKTPSTTSAAAKARDEHRRKMLAERRRQMKGNAQDEGTRTQDDIVIFTPENNN